MHLDQQKVIEFKRDLEMLQSDGNLTAAARARAIRRLERNDEYENIDGKISINQFHNRFEISNCEAGSTKPVPDFFEGLEISRVYNGARGGGIRLTILCQFMFQRSLYRCNDPNRVCIDQFEATQASYSTQTKSMAILFFLCELWRPNSVFTI
jgi:hypothetical protein